MKFTAVFNVYNEAQFIQEAVESAAWCSNIIVVDGAFKGFPTEDGKAASCDGTLEILQEIKQQHGWTDEKLRVITADTPWGVNEKMQAYLGFIDDGDYFLRMNGDEIFESDFSFPVHKILDYVLDSYKLPLYQLYEYRPNVQNSYKWIPKLIKKTPQLQLSQKHLVLTNKFTPPYKLTGGRNRVEPTIANVPGETLRIRHMCDYRSNERQTQNWLWLKEFYKLEML